MFACPSQSLVCSRSAPPSIALVAAVAPQGMRREPGHVDAGAETIAVDDIAVDGVCVANGQNASFFSEWLLGLERSELSSRWRGEVGEVGSRGTLDRKWGLSSNGGPSPSAER